MSWKLRILDECSPLVHHCPEQHADEDEGRIHLAHEALHRSPLVSPSLAKENFPGAQGIAQPVDRMESGLNSVGTPAYGITGYSRIPGQGSHDDKQMQGLDLRF